MDDKDIDIKNVITKTNLGIVKSSAEEMDQRRRNTAVIDYLEKLDEAKEWISYNLDMTIELGKFIEELPKGIWLGEIAKNFDPAIGGRIYWRETKEYLHTENINMFLRWLRKIKLSKHFFFDVIDLYESKNISKVIYCIHGLANFLKIRGIGRGIQKSQSVFTEEEKQMIDKNVENIPSMAYDEIKNRMDSEESTGDILSVLGASEIVVKTSDSVDDFEAHTNDTSEKEVFGDEIEIIKAFGETYVWQAAFSDVFVHGRASVCALRKFVNEEIVCDEEDEKTYSLYRQIVAQFKSNYAMQCDKDYVLRSVRLLVENQCRLRQIPFREYPLANDYKLFKRVLYNLLHDYELIYKIIANRFELPLGVFYPDNRIGDYQFSKFIEYLVSNGHYEEARQIAGTHFQASHAFSNLTQVFDAEINDSVDNANIVNTNNTSAKHKYSMFDLNPVDVAEYLYNELPKVNEYEIYNRKAMLDEAIKDTNVRQEIARRARVIVAYVDERLNFLSKMDLPYYVRMFVGRDGFFEEFIEPGILLSNNFIIAELVKYIFYTKDLFDTCIHSFAQEQLTYYKSKLNRTTNFDFSDYSPLRDWLESPANKAFGASFISRNLVTSTVNEAFLNCVRDDETLHVETSLEEVNNLIIVLKESSSLMGSFMKNMVSKMTLLRQKPEDAVKCVTVKTAETFEKHAEAAPVIVNGQEIDKADKLDNKLDAALGTTDLVVEHVAEESEPIVAHEHSKKNTKQTTEVDASDYTKDKFILALDTQLIDLDREEDLALDSILHSVKNRLMLLLYISEENSLIGLLHCVSSEEAARFGRSRNRDSVSLDVFKKGLVEDLDLLVQKDVVQKVNNNYKILDLVAQDIYRKKCRDTDSEYKLNLETLDALFKKNLIYKDQLDNLYKYTIALFSKMVTNKSGRYFNCQVEPKTRYGTYMYDLRVLKPSIYENIDCSSLFFKIMMDEPLIFNIEIYLQNMLWQKLENIRFDELLRLQEDSIVCFDVNGVMGCDVKALIGIINTQYISL